VIRVFADRAESISRCYGIIYVHHHRPSVAMTLWRSRPPSKPLSLGKRTTNGNGRPSKTSTLDGDPLHGTTWSKVRSDVGAFMRWRGKLGSVHLALDVETLVAVSSALAWDASGSSSPTARTYRVRLLERAASPRAGYGSARRR
jgi:hypothetical protein